MKWRSKTSKKFNNLVNTMPEFFIAAKKNNLPEAEIRKLIKDDILNLRPQYKEKVEIMTEFFYVFYNQIWKGVKA